VKALLYSFLLIPLLLKMCGESEKTDGGVRLAKVGSEEIYLEDAVEGMPIGLSSKDSIAYVKQFVQNRIKEILLYEQASKNIPEGNNIDDLVEDYRRSLVIHAYQQEMMNEKMQSEINDTVLQVFYENNRDRFLAGHDLVKGVFIKIPKTAPGLDKLRKMYKKSDYKSFQSIETFCVQNGGKVEFFFDHWVLFIDLLANASYDMSNPGAFLSQHTSLDVVVGDYEYLVYITDHIPAGSAAPYDYVKDEVRSVVANMKKTEFIHKFEDDLFRKAEKKGRITFYDVNPKNPK
jgi:hypothetical protein